MWSFFFRCNQQSLLDNAVLTTYVTRPAYYILPDFVSHIVTNNKTYFEIALSDMFRAPKDWRLYVSVTYVTN